MKYQYINKVLDDNREFIEENIVDQSYLPYFDGTILGCGVHGCVYETNAEKIVMKVTGDAGEIKFVLAAMHIGEWPEGMIQYHQAIKLIDGREAPIFALWRDEAFEVGEISDTDIDPDSNFLISLARCYELAKKIEDKILYGSKSIGNKEELVKEYIKQASVNSGEFSPVTHAMKWYAEHGIILGDVHLGNIGLVGGVWVIFDPGEAVFVDDRYEEIFKQYGLEDY